MIGPELRTERLLLRRWVPSDLAPFAEINSDPQVTEFLPSILRREESDAMVDRRVSRPSLGSSACRYRGSRLTSRPPSRSAGVSPRVLGSRLRHRGSLAAVGFGLDTLRLDEIVSFTTEANFRPRRVMERIGLTCDPADDFDHPLLPPDSALRRYVLYRKRREITSI